MSRPDHSAGIGVSPGPASGNRGRLDGTDRVLGFTRMLSFAIIPFLAVASVLLYVLPWMTNVTFAWTIVPPVTAMFLGSAYLGGIWFFAQVLWQRRWHRVRYGFPAVFVFATLVGTATFLHWDRFHPGHVSFVTWVVLYVSTPVLVLVALIANWPADPGTPDEHDSVIPRSARIVLAGVGVAATITGAVLFVVPSLLVNVWAWEVTPLTARVVGAVLTLPGFVNVWMLFDARWSAFRWVFQAELACLSFIVLALAIRFVDLEWERPAAWLVTSGLAASLVAFGVLYSWLDRRGAPGRPRPGRPGAATRPPSVP
jgi:hypothetical protein